MDRAFGPYGGAITNKQIIPIQDIELNRAVYKFSFPLVESAYSRLPEPFYRPANPTPVKRPSVVLWNSELAGELGLDKVEDSNQLAALFSGNQTLPGSKPLATAYAGHQFGHFVPQLGDGRAILLGEAVGRDGVRHEIQLKGAGPTPFSRNGDGRSSLGPVIREYLVSEAMHALGIPTTRALAATVTGEKVFRERVLPGAVFTRVARSHIRVGTFQYFAARRDLAAVRTLADHVIESFFPAITNDGQRYRAFFVAVRDAQAALIARWMQVGFIHGVMNTDNMSILGDTIDYGPCAFMDAYDPATVYSAIDQLGRYAYANQPYIAAWNLARLAETLLELIDPDQGKAIAWAEDAVRAFMSAYDANWLRGMKAKIGLIADLPEDLSLVEQLLDAMHKGKADFTLTFRRLAATVDGGADSAVTSLFIEPGIVEQWLSRWRERLSNESRPPADIAREMQRINPAFILRNHRIERAIDAAVEEGDFSKAIELHAVLARPFDDQPAFAGYLEPPRPGDWKCKTFCGT